MKKFIAAALGITLTCSFLLSAASCASKGSDIEEADVEFWSAPITEKIMQDQYDIYADVKAPATIDLRMPKNEYESAQIIMTPSKNVSYYDVTVSDLTAPGLDPIKSEQITVYHQKYIEVTQVHNGTDVPEGWYPDAVVPFSAVKERGENRIEEGRNQGIFLDFYVPSTAAAGQYSGTLTVDFNTFEKQIPIHLEVVDFTVSEETHSQSVFLVNQQFGWGELNDTREMYETYNNALSKYRLSPWRLINTNFTSERVPEYVGMVYEYCKQPRNSTFSLLYGWTGTSIDKNLAVETIVALAEKSFEENIDLLAKAVAYITYIDEPDQVEESADRVPAVCEDFRWSVNEAARIIENDSSITSPLKEQVVQSIRDIPNIVTSAYTTRFDDYIDTWCPKVDAYNTEEGRSYYAQQKDKWWYTCITPRAPFPSYHIEDRLYSARILSWMMMDYGVIGNLYWAVDVYGYYAGGGSYDYLEDYYQTAERFPDVNGDGWLLYPGKRYGVDGPLPSVRMLAIRDGNEDYEMLYDLKTKYAAISEATGYDFGYESVTDAIYGSLYSGTEVMTDSARFAAARNSILDLEVALNSEAQMCVAEQTEENGAYNFKVVVKDGFDLTADGQVLGNYETYGSGENAIRVYSYEKQLQSGGANAVVFSVQTSKGEVSVSFDLGGAVQYVSAEQLNGSVTVNTGEVTLNGEWLNAAFGQADASTTQELVIDHAFLDSIGTETSKLVFTLNNLTAEDVDYVVLFDYEKMDYYFDEASGVLKANGTSTISIENLFAFTWSRYGKLERIIIRFGDRGDAPRTVQLGGFYVYGV